MQGRFFCAVVLFGSVGFAHAADPIVYSPAPFEATPVLTWGGAYIGVHGGYAWGQQDDDQSQSFPSFPGFPGFPGTGADRFDMEGFVGGVHAGYNAQIGTFVYGLEGDIDLADVHGGTDFAYNLDAQGTLSLQSNLQSSLRVRAGHAVDDLLIYVTGGLAVGQAELTAAFPDTSYSDTNVHVGWTVGAGVEAAFTPNWIGRLEARYTDFGVEQYDLGPGGDGVNSEWSQTAVSAGLSYKF